MPFLLSFFLLLNAGAWFAFAMFLQDSYLIVPNVVGLVSGSAQLIIYVLDKNKASAVNSVEMVDYGADIHSVKAAEEFSIEVHSTKESKSKSISEPALSKRSSFHQIMRTLSSNQSGYHSGYLLVP
uniref:Bidirectional sugar transporter SWEET15 n=1 Tax=Nicotiana sylvestris TaxID=4096 RepID=A0A1U7XZQ9_NICSY|nr:PREDICTED: bidirectional sugar transporter SWEET15 [Nicotiana sylvestris]